MEFRSHLGTFPRLFRLVRLSLALALLPLAAACGSAAPPLANTHASAKALATSVLSAIERRDSAALRAVGVNEQEFRDHVWPELPSSRPERNLPFSYVWGDLHQKSEAALAGTLASLGGQHYELIAVRFLGETTQYKSYVVHRETALRVKDSGGAELELRLFGSTLEKDGRFKVFSYVVN